MKDADKDTTYIRWIRWITPPVVALLAWAGWGGEYLWPWFAMGALIFLVISFGGMSAYVWQPEEHAREERADARGCVLPFGVTAVVLYIIGRILYPQSSPTLSELFSDFFK
jgi:hypothetical protein